MPSAKLLFIAFVTALLSGAESFSLSPRTGAPSPTTLRASNPQMIQSWYDSGIRLKALQYDDEERLGEPPISAAIADANPAVAAGALLALAAAAYFFATQQ